MSFEELIKLKEKIGAKIYNQTVLGADQVKKAVEHTVVKRSNKNNPREISSKIRPKQIRAILERNSALIYMLIGVESVKFLSCSQFSRYEGQNSGMQGSQI